MSAFSAGSSRGVHSGHSLGKAVCGLDSSAPGEGRVLGWEEALEDGVLS